MMQYKDYYVIKLNNGNYFQIFPTLNGSEEIEGAKLFLYRNQINNDNEFQEFIQNNPQFKNYDVLKIRAKIEYEIIEGETKL